MKLNNIRLLVQDFERSFLFYENVLGLNCTFGDVTSSYASFDVGLPSGLALFKAEYMVAANVKNDDSPMTNSFVIVIEVDDVDEQFNQLKDVVDFKSDPQNMEDWGIRVVHFNDPEGNLLEMFSNLK